MMKVKYANRPDWGRILERRYSQEYVREGDFEGYVTYLFLDKVKSPLIAQYGKDSVCFVDDGYIWMMFFPIGGSYSVTVMINAKYEVVQWYFDMIASLELTEEGVPFVKDMYLDYIYLPSGRLVVKDEDELREALRSGAIGQEAYDDIVRKGAELKRTIASGTNSLITHIQWYIERLKELNESGVAK